MIHENGHGRIMEQFFIVNMNILYGLTLECDQVTCKGPTCIDGLEGSQPDIIGILVGVL